MNLVNEASLDSRRIKPTYPNEEDARPAQNSGHVQPCVEVTLARGSFTHVTHHATVLPPRDALQCVCRSRSLAVRGMLLAHVALRKNKQEGNLPEESGWRAVTRLCGSGARLSRNGRAFAGLHTHKANVSRVRWL